MKKLHLLIPVALADNTPVALGHVGRSPTHIQVVNAHKPVLHVGASTHFLRGTQQHPHLTGTHLCKQLLLFGLCVGVVDKGDKMSPKEKKELSDEEKESKSMRKQIQEKLIKFATRILVFMYLTDYWELSLKDVITQLEPGLFKKITGRDVKDFELLVSLNVFNGFLMNDAIYKFKRYEDSSLSYTGIGKHEGEDIGGRDTVIKLQEYERLFFNQQVTTEAPAQAADDIPENPFAFAADTEEGEEETPPVPAPKKTAPAPSPRPQTSS
ncbi:MAG: hypothetical protein LUH09_09635 [Clostridiales bacterium]|nr:hypothetical protein [Clostridiales bacterium]